MPRGEHLKKVDDDEILRQFDRVDLDRSVYSAAEIAQGLEITDEAVRQRLHKLKGDKVETEKIAGTTLWKRKGQEVFVDGGSWTLPILLGLLLSGAFTAIGFVIAGVLGAASIHFAGLVAFGAVMLSVVILVIGSTGYHLKFERWIGKYDYGAKLNRKARHVKIALASDIKK